MDTIANVSIHRRLSFASTDGMAAKSQDAAFAFGSPRPGLVVQESDGQRQVQGKPAIQIECARLARSGRANGKDGVVSGKSAVDGHWGFAAVHSW